MKRLLFIFLPGLLAWAQEEPGHAASIQRNLEQIQHDHGLSLALSGMFIVFSGLACISLFIALLPRILHAIHRTHDRRTRAATLTRDQAVAVPAAAAPATGKADLDPATLAAITMVLHAEQERQTSQNLKVTLGIHGGLASPWALSSKMRVVPARIKMS